MNVKREKNAVDVVQEQLEAYNARDLDRFAATYAEDIRIFRPPAAEPAMSGMAQLRENYRKRFSAPGLHADIVNRIVIGNKVIDHERVRGIRATPVEAVAVYEVVDGLIRTVWFFYPEAPFPVPNSAS
jgi:hypothetical protein